MFSVVYGVPVSWCVVVSKTIGIIVRLVGRNGRLGPGVPNVLWHVRWRVVLVGSGGRHEGRELGGDGSEHGRTGRE